MATGRLQWAAAATDGSCAVVEGGSTGEGAIGRVGAGNGCDILGPLGSFDKAGDSKTSSTSWATIMAGAVEPVAGMETCSYEASRGAGTWACPYCRYMSLIATLKPSHVFGSSSNSCVAEKVSQDDSSV